MIPFRYLLAIIVGKHGDGTSVADNAVVLPMLRNAGTDPRLELRLRKVGNPCRQHKYNN